MAGEGCSSGARSSSRIPVLACRDEASPLRTNMTHPARNATCFALASFLTLLLAEPGWGVPAGAAGAAGAPEPPRPGAGDSASAPPRALRVERILDPDALEQAGVPPPPRPASQPHPNPHQST